MEAIEKNNTSNTHQEKAKKLRKLRRWQIVVSLLGVAIVVWGIIEVACLFLSYNRTETSNDAQIEQYISPINLRASGYIKKIYFTEQIDGRYVLFNLCIITGFRPFVVQKEAGHLNYSPDKDSYS